jgi:hypothetical protein
MKRRTKQVTDYRELAAWNEARSLTVAAYQMTEELRCPREEGRTERAAREEQTTKLTAEIQRACISILSTLQKLGETGDAGSYLRAESTAKKLGNLLNEAHAQGIIGTDNFSLMMREVHVIKDALREAQGA